ncbi:pyridoxal phosphate-dependent aminotransferase [Marivita sp. GX14005]|uniref:pyridoxal phosphate-dependent aminotransferase n=1 Tax=Marivita sp. GX14005 TaxID=2942276 RepID=UPI0020194779|nr:pyridoxal phosphate-dependent aminotransferase [Marivita sp. GX14005]MCL3881071.1 pyridoxal phosphate-dependent aminotransferase [Marivita sp. GX14005]
MTRLESKFAELGAENAPGQEVRQGTGQLSAVMRGDVIPGTPVDFSHGDVDAFAPTPGAREAWEAGYEAGGAQAYTEYRGAAAIRERLARRLAGFTGAPVDPVDELILTPGTQGALFLALGALVDHGTRVAIIEPDYFANRKLVRFFGGQILPVALRYRDAETGPDLDALEAAFRDGAEVFVFSNPNNPTGVVYSQDAITRIAERAARYGVTVIVDQLYSRLLYRGESYTHLRAQPQRPDNLITIMGPSKTESLSGFRLGVAFGSAHLVDRMEKLQAIVSLRAAGYNQAVLSTWFDEPDGWMEDRIAQHEAIRDDLLAVFRGAGLPVATPQAGSYLFPELPGLAVPPETFVRLLRVQAGVTVTPGSEFAPQTASSIRLNFSQDHKAAVAAAKRIVEMVARYRA